MTHSNLEEHERQMIAKYKQEFPKYKQEMIAKFGTAQERREKKELRANAVQKLTIFLASLQSYLNQDFKISGLEDVGRSSGFRAPIPIEWGILTQKIQEYLSTQFIPGQVHYEPEGPISGSLTYHLSHDDLGKLGDFGIFKRDGGQSEIYVSGVPLIFAPTVPGALQAKKAQFTAVDLEKPKTSPERRHVNLQYNPAGRRIEPQNLIAWKMIVDGKYTDQAWKEAFTLWLKEKEYPNLITDSENKYAHDAFKKAMARRQISSTSLEPSSGPLMGKMKKRKKRTK